MPALVFIMSLQPFTGLDRIRNFRILWVGSTISNVGTWMHIVSQGWLMDQLTDSPVSLGLIGLTRAVPLLAFPLLGGVLADRVPRVRVLYVTQALAMLLAAVRARPLAEIAQRASADEDACASHVHTGGEELWRCKAHSSEHWSRWSRRACCSLVQ